MFKISGKRGKFNLYLAVGFIVIFLLESIQKTNIQIRIFDYKFGIRQITALSVELGEINEEELTPALPQVKHAELKRR